MRPSFATFLAAATMWLMAGVAWAQGTNEASTAPQSGVFARIAPLTGHAAPSGCFSLALTRDPVTFVETALHLQSKVSDKLPDALVSQERVAAARPSFVRAGGLQSRVPTLCADPTAPGCQCERSDTEHSHGDLYAMAEPLVLVDGFDVPACPVTTVHYAIAPPGRGADGVSSDLLRPPAA